MNPQQQAEMKRLKEQVIWLRAVLRDILGEVHDAQGEGPVAMAEALDRIEQAVETSLWAYARPTEHKSEGQKP